MSLSHLLAQIRPEVERFILVPLPTSFPGFVLFFSVSNGKERAHIEQASGQTLDDAWRNGAHALQRWSQQQTFEPLWLRVDVVNKVEAISWISLQNKLHKTKRNYFRFGLCFTPDFTHAMLEQEMAANAVLYTGTEGVATPNEKNLANYTRQRFGKSLSWPEDPEQILWRFTTLGVFSDGKHALPVEPEGRQSGYRQLPHWHDELEPMIHSASDYLARQVQTSGRYHYGWFPCFDRAIPTYNALRHASSTYALLEGWEVTQNEHQFAAIERALHDLSTSLIRTWTLPDGSTADFLVDTGDEIKLGGNAVCILAMAKYTELTDDERYREQMERLANGIGFMQNADTGGFVHVLHATDLSLKAENRIIYYDGEAAFALMRLYGISKNPRWLAMVEHAMEHFIAQKHWQAHDHWLSYCVNELTLHRPHARYYQFGLDNVRGHLDFVLNRITTYPTLLELMMAAQRMIERLEGDEQHRHLLAGFDREKFYRALEHRARYLANGFFWPELAMYFKNPQKIVGSFFIRHHSYRVRIDDVEHYLSGYVAYRKYLLARSRPTQTVEKQQLVFLCGNFRHEGNGIEIATIRRCALFLRQSDIRPMVITTSWNPTLARTVEALVASGKLPQPIIARTVYDWLPEMLACKELQPLDEILPGMLAKTRRNSQGTLEAMRYVSADKHVSHEDFRHPQTRQILLRRHYRLEQGTAYLAGIEVNLADGRQRFPNEGAFASAMMARNLDKKTAWHFLVDKNLPWREFVCSRPKTYLNATMTAVIHSTHRLGDGREKQAYRHLWQDETLLDSILVLTQQQRDDLAVEIPGSERLRAIPHHLEATLPLALQKKTASNKVLYMARYAAEKQHQLLFRAFTRVIAQKPDAELHLWGSGPLKETLAQWIKDHHLEDSIFLHGFSADLAGIHRQSSCSVLCSDHEGFSLFGLESLAYGTPLVSFDMKYGPRDLLATSGAGLLVPPGDEQALAEALLSLLNDPLALAKMQENAHRHATLFSEERIARLWQNWWQEMQALTPRGSEQPWTHKQA